jgi:SAM-dependent methyltransferase
MVPKESVEVAGRALGELQRATAERFGFEWRRFEDWGWRADEEARGDEALGSGVSATRQTFWSKTLFAEEDLGPGRLVLDAGCGNGRFAREAARTGAEAVAVDLGDGVISAFENTRSLAGCHVVRADLFRLPFADATFGRIFSIGVLHHTGDARAAFASLCRVLAADGLVVAHVYGTGRASYELLDRALRAWTTRLSIPSQLRVSRALARMALWLRGGPRWRRALYGRLYEHVNLLPTEHHMFDWWSAPIATHHGLDEVAGWFDEHGLAVVRSRPARGDAGAERARRRSHGAVTVLGRRSAAPRP